MVARTGSRLERTQSWGKTRLAPGELREMTLEPYPFPDKAGDYRFEVEAFVNGRLVGKTTAPTIVRNP